MTTAVDRPNVHEATCSRRIWCTWMVSTTLPHVLSPLGTSGPGPPLLLRASDPPTSDLHGSSTDPEPGSCVLPETSLLQSIAFGPSLNMHSLPFLRPLFILLFATPSSFGLRSSQRPTYLPALPSAIFWRLWKCLPPGAILSFVVLTDAARALSISPPKVHVIVPKVP